MNLNHLDIELGGERMWLLPQKAIYRPAVRQLMLSDVHLGKTSHFRKQGIALPAHSYVKDVDKLHFLLTQLEPHRVLILGDLFHSDYNREWLWLKSLLRSYPHIQFVLVEGNHDILSDGAYQVENLTKLPFLEEEHFIFSHHPLPDPAKLNFCGHVHPGFLLQGMARQSVKLPCFYHHGNHFILPAYGDLTGLYLMEKETTTCVYLVAENRVIEYR